MTDTPMSAAQRKALEEQYAAHLKSVIEQMQLRKWSMEQALASFNARNVEIGDKSLIAVAQAIFDFVAAEARASVQPSSK